MEPGFPWLPVGWNLTDQVSIGRLLRQGPPGIREPFYQLVELRDAQGVVLLLRESRCPSQVQGCVARIAGGTDRAGKLGTLSFGAESYRWGVFERDEAPIRVGDLPLRTEPLAGHELLAIARALIEVHESSWHESIFLPGAGACVPIGTSETDKDRRILAIRLATGGVAEPGLSLRQIHAINPWVTTDEAAAFFDALGVEYQQQGPARRQPAASKPEEFRLPGRPQLEALFREQVIDYHHRRDEYKRMGMRPTAGILLHGPPGSGKSFAVRCLARFLGWPVFEIHAGSIGSPFIHQTSMHLRQVFEQASAKAPSIVLMEELDALSGDRDASRADHKVEEVGELLKLIEKCSEANVLVVATTNREYALDDALLRRGRFDHVVKLDYPSVDEVHVVLEEALDKRPHTAGLNIDTVAQKLSRHPFSDIEWLANEAARLAVRSNKREIDDFCIFRAMSNLERRRH